jgi:hypothetical protein
VAKIVIGNNPTTSRKIFERISFPNIEIDEINFPAKVDVGNNPPVFTTVLERVSFPDVKITQPVKGVSINSVLPFRIRFTAIQIPSSIGNIPAIPLQVIGFSNYIL